MSDQEMAMDRSFVYENAEAKWAAVLAVAPAMGRLPDMVAGHYNGDSLTGEMTVEDLQDHVRSRVQTGIMFVFDLIKDNVNTMFENFGIHFGEAIDLLMDDIEDALTSDENAIQNYTPEEVCGRLYAYVAMHVYCRDRDNRESKSEAWDLIDERTGFYTDMSLLGCEHFLAKVLSSVNMDEEFYKSTHAWAIATLHTTVFLLAPKTEHTTEH
ncbi:hypothetical protein [Xanthomonas phage RTH11]|nr:hypothetical protein [Xanthomonas phage RTH11]